MIIKELLKHMYPSCKVKVYYSKDYNGCYDEYIVGDYYDYVHDYEECDNWAMYKDCLAIFLG